MARLENENIICISSVDWDPIWTRKQQVMSRLPKSNRILYVEPPITLLSPFKDPALWRKWKAWLKGVRHLNDNVYLYSPPVTMPFGNRFRLINRINQWLISVSLRRAASLLEMHNPIVWTYMPNTADLVDLMGQRKLLVYDCVDEHSEYTGFIDKAVMTEMETDLLKKCDIVFVTAEGLYRSKKDFTQTIYYLPNAANVQHFMKAQDPATPVPEDIGAIPGPIIGFVGVIQDWIDLDLVRDAAQSHPEWSFVMVGPVGVGIDVSSLKGLPNVYFLGRKDLQDLPGYIKAFDVCINPFKINELTDKVSPLKFYEYLASGKPIVSVNMPGVSSFADVVEISENTAGFIKGLEKAINGDSPDRTAARLERARENSWESRVEFMETRIMEKLNS